MLISSLPSLYASLLPPTKKATTRPSISRLFAHISFFGSLLNYQVLYVAAVARCLASLDIMRRLMVSAVTISVRSISRFMLADISTLPHDTSWASHDDYSTHDKLDEDAAQI